MLPPVRGSVNYIPGTRWLTEKDERLDPEFSCAKSLMMATQADAVTQAIGPEINQYRTVRRREPHTPPCVEYQGTITCCVATGSETALHPTGLPHHVCECVGRALTPSRTISRNGLGSDNLPSQ